MCRCFCFPGGRGWPCLWGVILFYFIYFYFIYSFIRSFKHGRKRILTVTMVKRERSHLIICRAGSRSLLGARPPHTSSYMAPNSGPVTKAAPREEEDERSPRSASTCASNTAHSGGRASTCACARDTTARDSESASARTPLCDDNNNPIGRGEEYSTYMSPWLVGVRNIPLMCADQNNNFPRI